MSSLLSDETKHSLWIGDSKISSSKQSLMMTTGLVLVVALIGLLMIVTGSAAAQSADAVVATDDTGDHSSIQNAINSASDSDRIKIKSGTYKESININKNVTIYTDGRVNISNQSDITGSTAISVSNDAESKIVGVHITGWRIGINNNFADNNLEIRNVTIKDVERGIQNYGSSGDWRVASTTIKTNDVGIAMGDSTGSPSIVNTKIEALTDDSGAGIIASKTSGSPIISSVKTTNFSTGIRFFRSNANWTIKSSYLKNGDINAYEATGEWKIEDTIIESPGMKNRYDGINAGKASGEGIIKNTTVINADDGINLPETDGNWTIKSVTLRNSSGDAIQIDDGFSGKATVRDTSVQTADNGIDAEESDGKLVVSNFTVRDTDGDGIDASNATGNGTVHGSEFRNMGDKSIDVIDSEGGWQIHESILTGGSEGTLDAWRAKRMINASRNYWGAADGPSETFCGSGGAIGGYNVTMYPYYTDASLTTLSSATTSGTVEITDSCLIPEDIDSSDEQTLTITVAQMSADGETDEISITMPEDVSVDNVNNPQAVGVPYEVSVTNDGNPVTLEVNPDEPTETVDFVIRVPMELSSSSG